uniref:ER membrane protein complex subunit 1 n=1 Tax=Cacopsylla melanoneura TaxID=428564 RepID=A0A8D8VIW5_9HEMI
MLKYILLGVLCISQTQSLYEDQVGKFDWKQSYVGKLKFSHIDSQASIKRIYVASEENAVAALSLGSGTLLWRQVLEKGPQGAIVYFHCGTNSIVTVSLNSLVRVWNPNDGSLLAEWTFPLNVKNVKFMVDGGNFYAIEVSPAIQTILVHTYKLASGSLNDVVKKIPASWLTESSDCQTNQNVLACLVQGSVKILFPSSGGQAQILQQSVPSAVFLSSVSSAIGLPSFKAGNIVLTVNNKNIETSQTECNSIHVDKTEDTNKGVVICVKPLTKSNIEVDILIAQQKISSNNLQLKTQVAQGDISVQSCFCKGSSPSCFCILSTQDHTTLFISTQGKVVWIREEALTSIISAEFLDLPVSDVDAAIEKEFDNQECGYFEMFTRRLLSQFYQIQTLLSIESPAFKSSALVRDKFGLHKLILTVTSVGKVFAIDNLSGKILWTLYLANVSPYSVTGKQIAPIFVQRSTRYVPYPAQVSILFKQSTGKEGVLFTLDPITGQLTHSDQGQKLSYQVELSTLLPGVNKNHLRGILLLDSNNQIHLEPPSSPVPKPYFLYKVHPQSGVLTGYVAQVDLKLQKVWELNFGQPVVHVASKNPLEKVHSQGRVLYDRSVLYKYLNPNLIAVATHTPDNVFSIHLVDVVSGTLIESIVHKRTIGPFHMVHSENWLVYVYFNEKTRRNEVSTVEMFEGKVQSNSTAFSSLSKSLFKPILDKQSYILPVSQVDAIKETITEKGITSKHILIALGTGGILEMPWVFLDPRRPSQVTPEMREEGQIVVEYTPELPILSESIINYNQTLYGIKNIHTAPSGLESTCFVFANGLDLFYTRVAPSKTFDILKEDFDYALICLVLGALIVGTVVSKKLASRKTLKQAWK